MNRTTLCLKYFDPVRSFFIYPGVSTKTITSKADERKLEECYRLLNIPQDSKQDAVRQAFLDLAKKYHPDSGSPEADMDKFVAVEIAFRTLSKYNTGKSSQEEVEKIVYDIQDYMNHWTRLIYTDSLPPKHQKNQQQTVHRPPLKNVMSSDFGPLSSNDNGPFTISSDYRHTAPQHRQYLSYEGVGHGNPFQRQKQWAHARAQRAANNVLEHRTAKSMASENTLIKKGQGYGKKHDIKTKYGFDRLVEDLIQESMSKGEFNNLSGKGKPLKDQNTNPYVDFTTHKLNEVLINNGFTPEWITMSKEIDQDKELLKRDVERERKFLGPYPLNEMDLRKWEKIREENKYPAQTLNSKINKYNIIVPLINKQKFHVQYELMCEEILKHGAHSVDLVEEKYVNVLTSNSSNEDIFGVFFKAISDLLNFERKK